MAFEYPRVIRFHETDAAGVVYFANVLTLCHEAYEASLEVVGIDVKTFFSAAGGWAVPIVHADVDFYRPLFCGDAIAFSLTPKQLDPQSFEIAYDIIRAVTPSSSFDSPPVSQPDSQPEKPLARALTRHVCIHSQTHRRCPLSVELLNWIAVLAELAEPND